MGRNMKSAKNQLRMINKDGDGLLRRVSIDMKALESTLRHDLTERITNMDDGLLELAKLRDAISAGLSETRRELERVHKRLGKANADISKAKEASTLPLTRRKIFPDTESSVVTVVWSPSR